jgi:xanthine dehydrogenase molybdopterin-binding subunit B
MLVMEEIVDRSRGVSASPPRSCAGRNLYRGSGETNTTHFLPGDRRQPAPDRLEAVQKEAGFAARRRKVDRWNKAHPR